MVQYNILQLALILLLGVGAQWAAWKLSVPSILFLLSTGFIAGPVLNVIQPNEIPDSVLFPFVSVAVAILVFEGALNLNLLELRKTGKAVRNLLSIGVLVTWSLTSFAALWILDLDFSISLLLGAVLTVTGPTVIMPLLRSVRVIDRLNAILKWEGIIIDPIGAILAVLVYEAFFGIDNDPSLWPTVFAIIRTILTGGILGFVAAHVLLKLIRYDILPEFLQSPFTMMLLIVAFSVSNIIQHESGLLTMTVMGILMANQKKVSLKRIMEFKETLQILLIAGLFIILSARIDNNFLKKVDMQIIFFVLAVLFFVRPICVLLSSIGTELKKREIIFLACIAPRGIVAAAIGSLLALELEKIGYEGGEILLTSVFSVIVISGITSAVLAKPIANFLKLSVDEPQGLLLVGSHLWARELAVLLNERQIETLLIDSNPHNIHATRMKNLKAIHANILEDRLIDHLSLGGIGKLLALTPNDEVNSLAAISFQDVFGKNNVYQLRTSENQKRNSWETSRRSGIRAKQIFSEDITFTKFHALMDQGWKLRSMPVQENSSIEEYKDKIYPLMICDDGKVSIYSEENTPTPGVGTHLISLASPDLDEASEI